jgi:hypothetical protein
MALTMINKFTHKIKFKPKCGFSRHNEIFPFLEGECEYPWKGVAMQL